MKKYLSMSSAAVVIGALRVKSIQTQGVSDTKASMFLYHFTKGNNFHDCLFAPLEDEALPK